MAWVDLHQDILLEFSERSYASFVQDITHKAVSHFYEKRKEYNANYRHRQKLRGQVRTPSEQEKAYKRQWAKTNLKRKYTTVTCACGVSFQVRSYSVKPGHRCRTCANRATALARKAA